MEEKSRALDAGAVTGLLSRPIRKFPGQRPDRPEKPTPATERPEADGTEALKLAATPQVSSLELRFQVGLIDEQIHKPKAQETETVTAKRSQAGGGSPVSLDSACEDRRPDGTCPPPQSGGRGAVVTEMGLLRPAEWTA